jgi:hypothetical protein
MNNSEPMCYYNRRQQKKQGEANIVKTRENFFKTGEPKVTTGPKALGLRFFNFSIAPSNQHVD